MFPTREEALKLIRDGLLFNGEKDPVIRYAYIIMYI